MTHRSVTLFHPEYGDFLYAALREGGTEAPLSVLSALARLGVDPWEEAAALSALSLTAANARLTTLLARLPISHSATGTATVNTARLLDLLPHRAASSRPALAAMPPRIALLPIFAAFLVCSVIVLSYLTLRNGPDGEPSTGTVSGSSSSR